MKLSIIIPVYNERSTINPLLKKINEVNLKGLNKEIILVDDFSNDGSRELIRRLNSKYVKIFQPRNMGKGAALKAGISKASGGIIVFQDSDLEYDPNDFKKLIMPLLEGKSSITFGTRFVGKKFILFGKKRTIHTTHWIGNKFLTFWFNLLYGTRLTDVEPCYKMFKKEILAKVKVKTNRFEYDIELMCKLIKRGHKIIQIPISYNPRKFEDGKKINWKDGIIAAWTMLKYRF